MARPRKRTIDRDGDGLSDREELIAGTNPDSPDTDADGLDDAAELSTGSALTPKSPREPETEKGRWARSQYLGFAQTILNDSKLNYETLYQRYAANSQEARSLDQSVAEIALQSRTEPKILIQLLAQGPFTQQQTQNLSPEQKKAAIPGMLQYSQSIVNELQQQRYVEYANAITGKNWNYADLYREQFSLISK
jgi:Bacterial TSP3 repeat